MRSDELHCENAVAHVQECCPDSSNLPLSCAYEFGFCESELPDIPVEQSRCIVAYDCEHLRQTVLCGGSESLACHLVYP